MELVIARHKEKDLSWLAKIPDIYNITLYNKASLGQEIQSAASAFLSSSVTGGVEYHSALFAVAFED